MRGEVSGKTLGITARLLAHLPPPWRSKLIILDRYFVIKFWGNCQNVDENITKEYTSDTENTFLLVLQLILQKLPPVLESFCRPLLAGLAVPVFTPLASVEYFIMNRQTFMCISVLLACLRFHIINMNPDGPQHRFVQT